MLSKRDSFPLARHQHLLLQLTYISRGGLAHLRPLFSPFNIISRLQEGLSFLLNRQRSELILVSISISVLLYFAYTCTYSPATDYDMILQVLEQQKNGVFIGTYLYFSFPLSQLMSIGDGSQSFPAPCV